MGATREAGHMTAAVLRELPATELVTEWVQRPDMAHDDVLIEVAACGICGTDLHIMSGRAYRPTLPFVLGHETVGRVVAAGGDPGAGWLGQRVAVSPFRGCGSCAWCANDAERLCPRSQSVSGVDGTWGGFARYQVASCRQLVGVPDGVGDELAAGVVDSGATALNAADVAYSAAPGPVVVVGGGPVGHLTAEFLRYRGRNVCVIEPRDARRGAIAELGIATAASAESAASMAGQPGVVVECSGSPAAVTWAVTALAPRGVLVLAGYALVPQVDFAPIARKELSIRGVRSGSPRQLACVLELAAGQRIRPPKVTTWPLGAVNDALATLRSANPPAKAVVLPGNS